jgi:hypothetical protein
MAIGAAVKRTSSGREFSLAEVQCILTAHLFASHRWQRSNGRLRQEVDVFVWLSQFQCQFRQPPASILLDGEHS